MLPSRCLPSFCEVTTSLSPELQAQNIKSSFLHQVNLNRCLVIFQPLFAKCFKYIFPVVHFAAHL